MSTTTAEARYNQLERDKDMYFQRALNNAKLTIPMVFPDKSDNATTRYETPYQSIGARGVNNLAAKLMKGLFPPNEPFFRLALGQRAKEQAMAQGMQEDDVKLEKALAQVERSVFDYILRNRYRITISEAIIQLIVAGNALLFLPPEQGSMKMYRLHDYVIVRDGIGNWIELVVRDKISYAALPQEVRKLIPEPNAEPDHEYKIYTHVYLKDGYYYSYQELEGSRVPNTDNKYPVDKCPWLPLRLRKMDGESYGRSYVDEYYGDLKTLNALCKASTEMAAVASFILYLVSPSSQLRIDKLKDAKSGDFFKGKPDDIVAFQLQKLNDMQIVVPQIQDLQNRLSYAFLMNSAVQRNAERVTAEEIRYVANELEDTVGNIYALLSLELQLPLVSCVMNQMMQQGLLPVTELGEGGIEPQIVTGVEALGRGYELTKLETFMQICSQLPTFAQRLNEGAFMSAVATGIGLDESQFVKSDEQMQAEAQAAQEAALQQQVAGPVANNLTAPEPPQQTQQQQQM